MEHNFTISRPDPDGDVFIIEFHGVKAGWSQDILVRSDAHHDNMFCDQKLEKRHLDQAKAAGAPIIDLGDLCCAMQGRYDKRASAAALRPELRGDDYHDLLVEYNAGFYKEYRGLMVLLAQGNHEASVLTQGNGTDLTKRIAKEIGAMAAPYSGWIGLRFRFGGRKSCCHWMAYSHGAGGNAPATRGVLSVNRMGLYYPDASIVATGHTHDEWIVPIARNRITHTGVQKVDRQLHIKPPGYQSSWLLSKGRSWERRMGMAPKTHGAIWLQARVDPGDVSEANVRLSARLAD